MKETCGRRRQSRLVSAQEKHPCFIVYMTASPAKSPSVTSGLIVSVHPAKPALPIGFLYEELPNVYVFSAHGMFTTFCAPFPNRISYFKILAMPSIYVLCSLLTRTQGGPAFREFGSRKHISVIKQF